MKTTILTLTAALVLVLTGADESKTAMVEQCRHICAIQYNSESPASLQELNLAEDQASTMIPDIRFLARVAQRQCS